MGKIRAFTPGGLQTMLSKIVQINVMAGGNTSSITTLGEDLAAFAELVTEELRGKRDNALCVSCVLPVAGWVRDGPSGYPYRLDVLAEGITGRDRAEVVLEPSSQDTAHISVLFPDWMVPIAPPPGLYPLSLPPARPGDKDSRQARPGPTQQPGAHRMRTMHCPASHEVPR